MYDKSHLDRADVAVLVSPAGKSAHLELGYIIGKGRPGIIYNAAEPDRWDVMALFSHAVVTTEKELLRVLVEIDSSSPLNAKCEHPYTQNH
jgi:hypothetical protein